MQLIQVFIRATIRERSIARATIVTIKTGSISLGVMLVQHISSPFNRF
jgi:hypothetical protein